MPIYTLHCMDKGVPLVVITITERFDYKDHSAFIQTFKAHKLDKSRFVVNLSKADYLDSSALGLLLILNKWAIKLHGSLSIKCPNDAVKKALEIANFDRYITIED